MSASKYLSLAIVILILSPVALACSSCLRDLIPVAEFDQRSWDEADHVFVAIVTRAEIQSPLQPNSSNEIRYSYRIEELLKGKRKTRLNVYTSRSVEAWDTDVQLVGCGDIVIVPGDRLLIFSDGKSDVYIGRCSASRVIQSILDGRKTSSSGTIQRLRAWAMQGGL